MVNMRMAGHQVDAGNGRRLRRAKQPMAGLPSSELGPGRCGELPWLNPRKMMENDHQNRMAFGGKTIGKP